MTESKYLARSTDPGTSQEAAEIAVKSGMVAAHCDQILGALVAHGSMTADEIAYFTGLLPHQIMKRLSDLAVERGIREKLLLIAGGTQVTNEAAMASGLDAGFGRGSKGHHVASFIVKRMRKEK